jgi:predicted transcriptional regulator
MKAKKVKVGIKDIKSVLNEFVETGEALSRGKPIKKEVGVYFTSFEAFRKALSPKRLALLHAIKIEEPSSLSQLAKILNRDIKNVAEDVKYLVQVGLIEKKESNKEVIPRVTYDHISLDIAV